ncbi:NrtR DNA-binding winged helix domain-containing protein [Gordonia insulae]|uniref:NrtR DNA-binding winged helix domain-containing protein n=1 Tax=Gordonia insulae TaxID=2420509 RepID=A0A3G8JQ55_9ACTN|nr:NUDIX hydrolase [Gordonia insulae]AZG47254.1 hypothetical protein D7316_03862 [Gordonia insulae]
MARSARKRLADYPHPNVAVDLAVLTVVDRSLRVVILRDEEGRAALPGRFVREGERVEDTVHEVLRQKLDLPADGVEPHLQAVFSKPDRDPRGWTISIAHAVTLPAAQLTTTRGELAAVTADGTLASGERLLYDHDEILSRAIVGLRERYEDRPDPERLLESPFTLSDLRATHEAVLGRRLMRDSFNRRVEPLLEVEIDDDGNPVTRVGGGRPARLFRLPDTTSSFGWRLPSH